MTLHQLTVSQSSYLILQVFQGNVKLRGDVIGGGFPFIFNKLIYCLLQGIQTLGTVCPAVSRVRVAE